MTLIQGFGSALNLNIHFHILFLDGVYVERPDGSLRFLWVKAPTSAEVIHLNHTLAQRVGPFLEPQGWLEQDAENSYLSGEAVGAAPMDPLLGHSIAYGTAVGPQAGRKAFTLQTLPACDEPDDDRCSVREHHEASYFRALELELKRYGCQGAQKGSLGCVLLVSETPVTQATQATSEGSGSMVLECIRWQDVRSQLPNRA